jgi:hypothetical protein
MKDNSRDEEIDRVLSRIVRLGLAGPGPRLVSIGQEPLRSARAFLARASNLFSAGGQLWASDQSGKEHYERRPR